MKKNNNDFRHPKTITIGKNNMVLVMTIVVIEIQKRKIDVNSKTKKETSKEGFNSSHNKHVSIGQTTINNKSL